MGYHESCFVESFHKKCHFCQTFLEHGIQQNVSSLIARPTKQDIKENNLVEGQENEDEEAEDTKTDDLSPDVILTQLEMEKDALCKVDEAYNIAVDRFMKANHQ